MELEMIFVLRNLRHLPSWELNRIIIDTQNLISAFLDLKQRPTLEFTAWYCVHEKAFLKAYAVQRGCINELGVRSNIYMN